MKGRYAQTPVQELKSVSRLQMVVDMNVFVDTNCKEPNLIRRNGAYKCMVGLLKLLVLKFALLPFLWSPTHILSSAFNFKSAPQYYLYVSNNFNLHLGMGVLLHTW
jgi:hypothetical protein